MKNGFTKIYDDERVLLRKTNSVAAYEIYMHLKDKYNYFKEDCYDLGKCISSYLDIPQRTVKETIKRLKDVGLITVTKRGKVNVYGFPIVDKIENTKIDTTENTNDTPNDRTTENKNDISKDDVMNIMNLNYETDGYSENLYDWLDENRDVIEGATNAMAEAQIMKKDTPLSIMGYNSIQTILPQLKGKDLKDAIEYIETRLKYKVNKVI